MTLIKKLLTCPVFMFGAITGISIFALAAALFSEVALGLEPCILCIYQRIPFVIGAVLGIIGLALRNNPNAVQALLALLGLNFLTNASIAFYHTGVEQKWWASAVEGCAVPNFTDTSAQSILENIMSAPTANCAEIPWQDPIIGLSMANYNVLLCLDIFTACALALYLKRHPAT
ncbi:MAG: disulfide bond formation protein B [Alphaproteobacteria bacterium]